MRGTYEPNVEQLTAWRNLLDAFGQLSAAWDAASESEVKILGEHEGDVRDLPEDLVVAFAHAGVRGTEVLAGVARVLATQQGSEAFEAVADLQRQAHQRWSDAHSAVSGGTEKDEADQDSESRKSQYSAPGEA